MKQILSLIVLFHAFPAFSCTTFFINRNGQLIFGRNYDWVAGQGMVNTNLRGLAKTSFAMPDGSTINWVSKFGSITFNQYGKEFPTGGMNEKGLVVELMWLNDTKYPSPDQRPSMTVLQWLQYQLDNNSTVSEVIQTDSKLRISSSDVPLHYLVADASGDVAAIEFLNGKMVVHRGKDLPIAVLANNTYDNSWDAVKNLYGASNISIRDNSDARFAKACKMVKEFQDQNLSTPVVDYSFKVLNEVSQADYTKWTIVYDLVAKKIYFKTHNYPQVKSVEFSAFDFSCTASAKAFDMNQSTPGSVNNSFVNYTSDFNRKITEATVKASRGEVNIKKEEVEALIGYAEKIKCK
jgi:penicillin V acylase-like amidase (Ntn superfamily)